MRRREKARASTHQLKQRAHILKHAAALFSENGYAATTMDTLSAATEMNKASLYYYFESKQEILFILLRDATSAALEASGDAADAETAIEGIRKLVRTGVANLYAQLEASRIFVQEQPYLSQTLSSEQYDELMALRRRYQKIVNEVISKGVKSGEFRDGNVRLLGLLFTIWLNAPLRLAHTVDADEVAESLIKLALAGIEVNGTQA